MVPLKLLESRGITPDSLKAIFSQDRRHGPADDSTEEGKRQALYNRITARVRASQLDNIRNHKIYHALDFLWNEAYHQVSPTLLQTLMDQDADAPTVTNALKSWGFDINEVIVDMDDPKTAGKKVKRLNVPAFFKVTVPLARAYVTARWAKIVNDMRQVPFFKYEPAVSNLRTRTQAEALTARVEVMSRQFGYFNVMKQAVLQDLFYGFVVIFPYEEWWSEEQETDEADRAQKDDSGTFVKDEKGRMKVVVSEGIRYHIPHPARTYWDKAYRPSTLNTDIGCQFAGYWKIVKWGEVRRNKSWWNTDKVSLGATDWSTDLAATFLNTIYGGCVMQFPTITVPQGKDRETAMADFTYSSTNEMDDKALVISEHYEKIVPSECGLGDYDYPVWFRFVVANDVTILYAAPMAYSPAKWSGYDSDENREDNSSLALECLPFQDAFTNLLTQHLHTVKQNLVNLTFVDEDVVPQSWLDRLTNYGEKIWRSINILPFSSKKLRAAQNDHRQAFYSHRFPQMDTNGLIAAMRMLLEIMERVLQMSSQELAQAASHELRQDEVRNIASATANRLTFTATPLHQLREAMKHQIYEALMAYGQDEFWTQIAYTPELTKESLAKLGFTWDDQVDKPQKGDTKLSVKAKKSAVSYFMIASNRDGDDRIDNSQIALTMATALGQWMSNPILAEAIGTDQAIEILNLICHFAGFPNEVKFTNKADPNAAKEQQQQQQMQEIVKMAEQLKNDIMTQMQAALKTVVDEGAAMKQETDAQIQEIIAKLEEIDKVVATSIQMIQAHDQATQGAPLGAGGPPVEVLAPATGGPFIPPANPMLG